MLCCGDWGGAPTLGGLSQMFWSRKFLLMPKNKNKPSQSFSLVSGSGGNHLQVLTNPIFAQNDPLGDSRERERERERIALFWQNTGFAVTCK